MLSLVPGGKNDTTKGWSLEVCGWFFWCLFGTSVSGFCCGRYLVNILMPFLSLFFKFLQKKKDFWIFMEKDFRIKYLGAIAFILHLYCLCSYTFWNVQNCNRIFDMKWYLVHFFFWNKVKWNNFWDHKNCPWDRKSDISLGWRKSFLGKQGAGWGH